MRLVNLLVQGIYSLICLLEVILCIVYQIMGAVKGDGLLFLMLLPVLPMGAILIIFPMSLICNIRLVISDFKEKSHYRVFWLIWTFLSPILYITCFWFAAGLFVGVTGGV